MPFANGEFLDGAGILSYHARMFMFSGYPGQPFYAIFMSYVVVQKCGRNFLKRTFKLYKYMFCLKIKAGLNESNLQIKPMCCVQKYAAFLPYVTSERPLANIMIEFKTTRMRAI